nr:immunoglobulin light chain junction region [Macaca mulatta]MOX48613.1 immunoglobulin light chain junction region [Macaca mulatta]MOX49207.1 immunoglobulin light chain junction region [Macaca mulatta]MOX49652.1 immunoglobulin light chain junction region [Macaca mulatta]MOX49988.1 immunoglobulin light chain junction region [Macaca mulatta]
CQHYKSAPRTF